VNPEHARLAPSGQPYSSQVTSTDPEEFYHVQYRESPNRRSWSPMGGTDVTPEGLNELREWTAKQQAACDAAKPGDVIYGWQFRIMKTTVEIVPAEATR